MQRLQQTRALKEVLLQILKEETKVMALKIQLSMPEKKQQHRLGNQRAQKINNQIKLERINEDQIKQLNPKNTGRDTAKETQKAYEALRIVEEIRKSKEQYEMKQQLKPIESQSPDGMKTPELSMMQDSVQTHQNIQNSHSMMNGSDFKIRDSINDREEEKIQDKLKANPSQKQARFFNDQSFGRIPTVNDYQTRQNQIPQNQASFEFQSKAEQIKTQSQQQTLRPMFQQTKRSSNNYNEQQTQEQNLDLNNEINNNNLQLETINMSQSLLNQQNSYISSVLPKNLDKYDRNNNYINNMMDMQQNHLRFQLNSKNLDNSIQNHSFQQVLNKNLNNNNGVLKPTKQYNSPQPHQKQKLNLPLVAHSNDSRDGLNLDSNDKYVTPKYHSNDKALRNQRMPSPLKMNIKQNLLKDNQQLFQDYGIQPIQIANEDFYQQQRQQHSIVQSPNINRIQKQKVIMNTYLTPIVFISKDFHLRNDEVYLDSEVDDLTKNQMTLKNYKQLVDNSQNQLYHFPQQLQSPQQQKQLKYQNPQSNNYLIRHQLNQEEPRGRSNKRQFADPNSVQMTDQLYKQSPQQFKQQAFQYNQSPEPIYEENQYYKDPQTKPRRGHRRINSNNVNQEILPSLTNNYSNLNFDSQQFNTSDQVLSTNNHNSQFKVPTIKNQRKGNIQEVDGLFNHDGTIIAESGRKKNLNEQSQEINSRLERKHRQNQSSVENQQISERNRSLESQRDKNSQEKIDNQRLMLFNNDSFDNSQINPYYEVDLDSQVKQLCFELEYQLNTGSHRIDLTIRNLRLKHPIFRQISISAFNYIIENSFLFKLRPNQGAYKEGLKAMKNIYFVLYGQFNLRSTKRGIIGESIALGQTLGEEIIFQETQPVVRKESCISDEDAGLLQMNVDDLHAMNNYRQKKGGGISMIKDYQVLLDILEQNYQEKSELRKQAGK
ncbi:UNKNOWN [Stylonychia lemnae]|uniref:Cyclic nucleotide-binding domain-containing protein n=1 Tax=Stylonychia lemnae TaxID=5949 RepID=A0A078A577_STYLE|nr:UNKNOWN [Stylonychia lemnae]|eukprot:CDW77034.1 UNKNOWN [Stylonychia lemnae]